MNILHTETDARGRVLYHRLDAGDVADSANGAPPYIDIKVRMTGNSRRLGLDLARIGQRYNDMPEDERGGVAGAEIWEELRQAEYKILAARVTGWNWQDERGEPLPQPGEPAVFGELYEDVRSWIFDQINTLDKYRSTEGNAESGAA